MNIGHEDDALKPYIQPSPDFTDEKRLGKETINGADDESPPRPSS